MRVWDMSLLQDDPPAARKRPEPIYGSVYTEADRRQLDQSFARLQRNLILGLIFVFLTPNALFALYFHVQFTRALESGAALAGRPQDGLLYGAAGLGLFFALVIFLTIRRLMKEARRRTEKAIRLQEMLAHASRLASIGELAAGVAHEINNPLAIIMAESGVIRDMFNPEFGLDHSREALEKELEVIDRAATRARNITKRLQEMGKARAPQSEPCDINAQVETVLARLKKVEFKNKKHIEIKTELDPALPPVLAEAEPLRQVFANLLVNAADAIGEGRGLITVRTGMEERMIAVTISDNGRGIPPENLQRIFHPFFTTKGGERGVGLGLSIAASVVKYLGGRIKVDSTVGKGSTFTVLLPNNFSCPLPGK